MGWIVQLIWLVIINLGQWLITSGAEICYDKFELRLILCNREKAAKTIEITNYVRLTPFLHMKPSLKQKTYPDSNAIFKIIKKHSGPFLPSQ